jgi:hypothetical protein
MLLDGRAYTSPVVHRGLFNLDTLGDRTSQRAVVRAVCVLDNRVGIVEQQRDMRVRPPILLRSAAMRVALRPEPVGSCVLGYRSWRGPQTVQARACSRVDRPREAPPFREVVPEPLSEIETRPVEAGFHRSRAQIENHPDLLGGQALDLGQHVHRSVHRR